MTAPDPAWVEAGARAIDGEEATATSGYYGASYRVDSDHAAELARAVIAAVAPLIAEDIAREIGEKVVPLPGAVPHSVIVAYAQEIARDVGGAS